METLRPFVIVFVGAGLGGALRHGLNVGVTRALGTGFPWATFLINITGSIAMGLLVGALAFRASAAWTQSARLFIATGILGGYTTFSTFSLDTILLIERNQFGAALAYVGGSVLLGVGGLWAGLALMRSAGMSKVDTIAILEDETGMRLDRWFRRRYPDLPQTHLNKIVRKGEVRVDGKRVEISTRLETGQTVRVPPLTLAAKPTPDQPAPPNPADAQFLRDLILFEDRDVIVFNKPYGLAVQGGSGTKRHIDGMLAALADKRGERPVLVHRLDRDTSGVLLCAKSRKMAADLGATFRSRGARKIYWALVEGVPKPEQGRISMFLAKGEGMGDERGAKRRDDIERMRVAKHGDPEAQHSLTLYATVDKVAPRLAWLSMRPITGRTHQLRAHCEAIGHPIIGDPKYNRRPENDPARHDPLRAVPPGIEKKLHLLARRLTLPHPRGGSIDVTAPLPPHMKIAFDMFGFEPPSRDPIEDAPDA